MRFPWFKALLSFILVLSVVPVSYAQKNVWSDRLIATNAYLQQHMWNAATGNFVRRSDQRQAPGSDAWGITIMLDAYAYMVSEDFMNAEALKQYYHSSTNLYQRTSGASGARILAQQGSEIYIGGDDDLQWISALMHCYEVTKDSEYLQSAASAFNALIDQGFWIEKGANSARGWAWNSADRRPNGVSTAYGALAAARLYKATGLNVYKWWASASLAALSTPQVGYFPRDMMVAANAASIVHDVSHQDEFVSFAEQTAKRANDDARKILDGKLKGEINPTDIGDVAEGYARVYEMDHRAENLTLAKHYIELFTDARSASDIAKNGFSSRYDAKGNAAKDGAYLGVPLTVGFLPENAEMLKLCAIAYKYF